MPVIEPVVSKKKLRLLLSEQHESSGLDYKRKISLDEKRDLVELAKDVGAMQVDGGFIVIGADNMGTPTGDLTQRDALLLDEATIRPKLAKYIPEPFEIRCAVHTIESVLVAVIYIAPNTDGWCIFKADGNYPGGCAFRAGNVYARHGTSSEPWQQSDIDRIIARRMAALRADWRREFAADQAAINPSKTESI